MSEEREVRISLTNPTREIPEGLTMGNLIRVANMGMLPKQWAGEFSERLGALCAIEGKDAATTIRFAQRFISPENTHRLFNGYAGVVHPDNRDGRARVYSQLDELQRKLALEAQDMTEGIGTEDGPGL